MDPDQERRRLEEVYASRSDGELAQIAADASDLTEVARETLRAELTKRDLYGGQLEQPAEPSSPEFRDLVEIRRYWNLLDGELAKGRLEAEGIEAFLFDDNMLRMDWFNANAIGGVKLRVDASNAEAAHKILEEDNSVAESPEGEPDEPEDPNEGSPA